MKCTQAGMTMFCSMRTTKSKLNRALFFFEIFNFFFSLSCFFNKFESICNHNHLIQRIPSDDVGHLYIEKKNFEQHSIFKLHLEKKKQKPGFCFVTVEKFAENFFSLFVLHLVSEKQKFCRYFRCVFY